MKTRKMAVWFGSLSFFVILLALPIFPLFIGIIVYVTSIPLLYLLLKKISYILSSSKLEVNEIARFILPKGKAIYTFSSVSALFTGEGWILLVIRWFLNNDPTIFLSISYEILILWLGLSFPPFLRFLFVFELPVLNWLLKYLIPIFLLASLDETIIILLFSVGIIITAIFELLFVTIMIKSDYEITKRM